MRHCMPQVENMEKAPLWIPLRTWNPRATQSLQWEHPLKARTKCLIPTGGAERASNSLMTNPLLLMRKWGGQWSQLTTPDSPKTQRSSMELAGCPKRTFTPIRWEHCTETNSIKKSRSIRVLPRHAMENSRRKIRSMKEIEPIGKLLWQWTTMEASGYQDKL